MIPDDDRFFLSVLRACNPLAVSWLTLNRPQVVRRLANTPSIESLDARSTCVTPASRARTTGLERSRSSKSSGLGNYSAYFVSTAEESGTGFTGYFPSACFSEHDARVDATSRTSPRGQRCTHCSGGAPTETQNVRTVYLRQTLTSFTILAQAKYGLGDPARASRPKQGIEDGRNRCLDTRQSDATAFVIRGFHSFSGFSTRLSPKISIRYDSR